MGVLSTAAEDAPYASLVAFAVTADDRPATPRATRKFANMAANCWVALLVNNSVNHPQDFHMAKAVTASGICFTLDPIRVGRGIIEAVHGMNPPLVDGQISPDRWTLDGDTGAIIEHRSLESRDQWQPPDDGHRHPG